MAKPKTKGAEGGAKNKAKGKAKVKSADGKPKKAKKAAASAGQSGYEALAKLADHPLVAELVAVAATAAVAALAERGLGGKSTATRQGNAVKAAGKAAAAAIGKRIVSEYQAVKDASAESAKKKP